MKDCVKDSFGSYLAKRSGDRGGNSHAQRLSLLVSGFSPNARSQQDLRNKRACPACPVFSRTPGHSKTYAAIEPVRLARLFPNAWQTKRLTQHLPLATGALSGALGAPWGAGRIPWPICARFRVVGQRGAPRAQPLGGFRRKGAVAATGAPRLGRDRFRRVRARPGLTLNEETTL